MSESGCPVPNAEDRLDESYHFLEALERDYHDPRSFRYNLNALLSATASIRHLLQKDIERLGLVKEWAEVRDPYWNDPALALVYRSRNVTLHQEGIYEGSKISVGLFRGRKMKLSFGGDVPGDQTSAAILVPTVKRLEKVFLDPTHAAWWEQGGLERLYFVPELGTEEDALTVIRRAIMVATNMVGHAHLVAGVFDVLNPMDVEANAPAPKEVTVLLETDLDPSLVEQWGWG